MSPLVAPVLALALALPATSSVPLDGLSSGGDPYFPLDGNTGYQVLHYAVHDTYRPGTDRLRGTTVVEATATQDLTRLSLDLVLRADQVRVDGQQAEFTKPRRHELHVTLPERVADGDSFSVTVRYHGRPGSVGAEGMRPNRDLYFHRPGETVAMGEPQNGPWWFAANETPADKATFDITVRVPRGQEVVSGGALVSHRAGHRWSRWHWRVDQPITTYMAFFAAGQFRLDRGTVDGRPFAYAVSTRLKRDAQRTAMRRLRLTGDLVRWLEGELGTYPFGEIGGVIPAVPSGYALETATRPVYPWFKGKRKVWVPLLVHELAHQWFGDDVALRRWRDVWLNEGFATYVEWWYAAQHGGPGVARHLRKTYRSIPADRKFWTVRVGDPGPELMWNNPVYVRGAMTLAALRNRIGSHEFSTVLEQWLARHHRGHGTGAQFRALAEEVSGEDLAGFFEHWLHDTVKPKATVENGLG
jgi:aminopeptidase N